MGKQKQDQGQSQSQSQSQSQDSVNLADDTVKGDPRPLGQESDTDLYPDESPIEEGIVEEQQGDLEGLDGENSDQNRDEEDLISDDTSDLDELDADDTGSDNVDAR